MQEYLHGVETERDARVEDSVTAADLNVQVAVGTAPINLLADPGAAVNKLILCKKSMDVAENLGSCDDYQNYTLMQTAYASFKAFGVGPVVMINVLDPSNARHVTAVAGTEREVNGGVIEIAEKGILLDTVKVSKGETLGEAGKDFVASFDDDGNVVIALTDDGAFYDTDKLTVAYTMLNPKGVTAADIIGGEDEDGTCTGLGLVDDVYQKLNVAPGIITAPGYSENAAVAAAIEAKAMLSGDLINAIGIVDIETKETKRKEDVEAAKNKAGLNSRWLIACWPKVLMAGGEIMSMSAAAGALLQYLCITNENYPQSPDNKDFGIEGTCLEDGTEVFLKLKGANNYVVGAGVLTALYMNGWKAWGSNTSRYPKDKNKPNMRFIKNVMMSNYIENRFKTEYLPSIGKDADIRLIESVVNNFNAELNAQVPARFAGAKVMFDKNDNPKFQMQEGRFVFTTVYADYTPLEYIKNKFIWDASLLTAAFFGEGDE